MNNRRAGDNGWLCWAAARAGGAWDFIDKRQIIRRAAFIWVLWITGRTMEWTWDYAWHANMTGGEIAAVIGSIWGPLALLQGAVFKFYDQAQASGGVERSRKQREEQTA